MKLEACLRHIWRSLGLSFTVQCSHNGFLIPSNTYFFLFYRPPGKRLWISFSVHFMTVPTPALLHLFLSFCLFFYHAQKIPFFVSQILSMGIGYWLATPYRAKLEFTLKCFCINKWMVSISPRPNSLLTHYPRVTSNKCVLCKQIQS